MVGGWGGENVTGGIKVVNREVTGELVKSMDVTEKPPLPFPGEKKGRITTWRKELKTGALQ